MSPRAPSWVPRRRRWGEAAPETPEQARELILDAAARCIERHGVVKLTMSDVADDADISRPTLYKYFPTKEAMLEAFLLRLAPSFIERTRAELGTESRDLGARLVETVAAALRVLEADPWGKRLLRGPDAAIVLGIVLTSPGILSAAAGLLEPILTDAKERGLLRWTTGPRELAAWGIRLIGSYLVFDHSNDFGDFRRTLTSILVPVTLRDAGAAAASELHAAQ